jgi:predicted nucleic acid-binding protein
VKLVIEEPESAALVRHLGNGQALVTSRIALVEVPRATGLANPEPAVQEEAQKLLASCMLIDVSDGLLRVAARLATAAIMTLDAIHLASALRIAADELVAYDRRLLRAAVERGLATSSPGAEAQSTRDAKASATG